MKKNGQNYSHGTRIKERKYRSRNERCGVRKGGEEKKITPNTKTRDAALGGKKRREKRFTVEARNNTYFSGRIRST